jgi:hypothetical protein
VGSVQATAQRQDVQRAHPSHSPSMLNRAVAAVSFRVMTHEPATCGSSTMVPSRLLTIRLVNPTAPCCVQVTAMARESLPCAATGQLAQRRRSSPLGGEQILDHCASQGLMPDPVRRHSLRGQQQGQCLLFLAKVRVCAGPVSQMPAAGCKRQPWVRWHPGGRHESGWTCTGPSPWRLMLSAARYATRSALWNRPLTSNCQLTAPFRTAASNASSPPATRSRACRVAMKPASG